MAFTAYEENKSYGERFETFMNGMRDFFNAHSKAIIISSIVVSLLAATVVGLLAVFAWPVVAGGFAAFGLSLVGIAAFSLVAKIAITATLAGAFTWLAAGTCTLAVMAINGIKNTFFPSENEDNSTSIPEAYYRTDPNDESHDNEGELSFVDRPNFPSPLANTPSTGTEPVFNPDEAYPIL